MGLLRTLLALFALCCRELLAAKDYYSHSVLDMDNKPVALDKYRGKVTLVVNVASACGFTDRHYKQMVKAQDAFGKTGKFNILAFPCNQFGSQEPKDNQEILEFAQTKYKANFPIFAKTNVKDEDVPDHWAFITGKVGYTPDWNFYKFLIDHRGAVVKGWGPWSDIDEIWDEIRDAVDAAMTADGQTTGDAKPPAPPPPRKTVKPPSPAPPEAREPGQGGGPMRAPEEPKAPIRVKTATGNVRPPPPPPVHDDL